MSATLLALALATPSARAADETPNPWKFEFHGWVSASLYSQDQAFPTGQGQGLLFTAPAPNQLSPCKAVGGFTCPTATVAAPYSGAATGSGSQFSGDIRNSRFAFAMSGPKVFGDWQPRGYLEFDLFGLNSAGAFGTEGPIPRIRVAIAELKSGGTNIQVGQQNQLVVPQIPGSLSHITFPVTYGAGTIGWRSPGVRVSQTIPLDSMKLELAAEATKNVWNNDIWNALGGPGYGGAAGGPGANTPLTIGYGEASGLPMFQARAKLDGTAGNLRYTAYVVGVYHKIDLNGFGNAGPVPAWAAGKTSIDGNVFEVGGNITFAPLTLAGNYYTGKTTGGMIGSLLAFGDIKDTGYWVQLSGNFTKELSLNVLYGAGTPDKADMRRVAGNLTKLANTVMGGMLKYQESGYAVGLEYWRNDTDYSTSATTQSSTNATQVIATVNYFF